MIAVIEEPARAVLAAWEHGDLAGAVRLLAEGIAKIDAERKAFAAVAAAVATDDELEVDDETYFSEGEGGCWVNAWVWVPTNEDGEAWS